MPPLHHAEHLNTMSVDQRTDDVWLGCIVESTRRGITDPKNLAAELVALADEQQGKAGREIHDDLCSQLSGISCLTKMLESQLRKDQQQQSRLLSEITNMVASAGETARKIAQELIPSVLEAHGLVTALRELAARQQRRYGMECVLKVGDIWPFEDIKPLVGIQIYRIAQEAVSNAIRHSDADRILIYLSTNGDRIDFSVTDDGKGMAEDLVSIGMGLATMMRRAELINAAFSIRTAIGAGVTIHCSIPLDS
jgi:signal transduction histidine kinase